MIATLQGRAALIGNLLRFQYHGNFAAVVLGAVTFAREPLAATLAVDLVMQYVTFVLLLYGGIYTVNAVADADSDARHPRKRNRPVPSGKISKQSALGLAAGLLLAAFAGTLLWEGSMRMWPVYAVFVLVNGAYSFKLRNSRWRYCVGLTAALRLHLGALLTRSTIPPPCLRSGSGIHVLCAMPEVSPGVEYGPHRSRRYWPNVDGCCCRAYSQTDL